MRNIIPFFGEIQRRDFSTCTKMKKDCIYLKESSAIKR